MTIVNLLIIDENHYIKEGTLEQLYQYKFKNVNCVVSKSNPDALDKLSSSSYDVIAYDLGMDNRDSTALKIRDLKPGAIFVAMSAMANDGHTHYHSLPEDCFDLIQNTQNVWSASPEFINQLRRYGIVFERKDTDDIK